MTNERIEELRKQIAELNARWPAHSVPPAMLQQLEELEEELGRELRQAAVDAQDPPAKGGSNPIGIETPDTARPTACTMPRPSTSPSSRHQCVD